MARGGDSIDVSIAGDEQAVVVSAMPSGTATSAHLDASTDALVDLLTRTAAVCTVTLPAISLRIPALVELRRRERSPG
jgi:hypothetical protein